MLATAFSWVMTAIAIVNIGFLVGGTVLAFRESWWDGPTE